MIEFLLKRLCHYYLISLSIPGVVNFFLHLLVVAVKVFLIVWLGFTVFFMNKGSVRGLELIGLYQPINYLRLDLEESQPLLTSFIFVLITQI